MQLFTGFPVRSFATLIPSAALMEVDECPAPKQSYSDSFLLRPEPRPPPRQHLVRVALVSHIPHDPVLGGVEHVVEGNRELGDPQGGGEMSSCLRHRLDHLPPQLVRQLLQLRHAQLLHVRREVHRIQHGLRLRHVLAGRLHPGPHLDAGARGMAGAAEDQRLMCSEAT
eukprot:754766-Hanusia_phi.AAC.1